MQLRGTVAIVTGGNGGLGQRICHALAAAGSDIALIYARSREGAEGFAQTLRGEGVRAEAIQCDVSDAAQVQRMVAQVMQQFGRIDVLVNDAAYNKWIPFNDLDALTLEEWQKILATNLTGPMLCIKAVAPFMKKGGAGRIINIASVAGLAPSGSSIPYAVSKAGLIHLTRCMAVGLAPDILVNCIAPGYLEDTRATANLDPAYRQRARDAALLKRAADKDEIAEQVVALCQADTITGQTLVIDAGRFFH
ncbi:MAG TPA: SDR family NAD(P)-dependent oxidoreductase [Burkholderiales bacterium]|nr:SDR family NAD(P)-dependent oxidoreductase [Burkholderiales bacterium]